MLLYIVLHDCGVGVSEISLRRGLVTESMVRKEPYYSLYVETLDRLVIVCDEEGNRTDLYDTSSHGYRSVGREAVEKYTKLEKTAFGSKFPESHTSLRFSKNWSDRIYTLLTCPIPYETKQEDRIVERPRIIETLQQRADSSDFYTDEQGERWGSRVALAESISSRKLSMNPDFIKLLDGLPYQIVRSGNNTVKARSYSAVITAMKEHSILSAYFRKTDETKFYTDESGERWGSMRTICDDVSSGVIANSPNFIKLFSLLPTQKILVRSNFANGYRYSDVQREMKKSDELAIYLRKADESRFYTDEEGERWGSMKTIADYISWNPNALAKSPFYQRLLQKLPAQKILELVEKPCTTINFDGLVAIPYGYTSV